MLEANAVRELQLTLRLIASPKDSASRRWLDGVQELGPVLWPICFSPAARRSGLPNRLRESSSTGSASGYPPSVTQVCAATGTHCQLPNPARRSSGSRSTRPLL
jgi:hypothetical protein